MRSCCTIHVILKPQTYKLHRLGLACRSYAEGLMHQQRGVPLTHRTLGKQSRQTPPSKRGYRKGQGQDQGNCHVIFFSKNVCTNLGPKPHFGEIWIPIMITSFTGNLQLSVAILSEIYSACRNIATFCPAFFFDLRRRWPYGTIASSCFRRFPQE